MHIRYYLEVLNEYDEFRGRVSRKKFWMFVLISTIISVLLVFINIGIFLVYSLLVLLPSLGVTARRLHDTNRSAWFLLLELVPIIGGIYILILCAEEGTTGENEYGKSPK
ncbi:MAG: DUF805 domain-containing protein [Halanaerobiales bacterium]|nr:DUF805 domain-containing protein [Halanaerobiales bacterium]